MRRSKLALLSATLALLATASMAAQGERDRIRVGGNAPAFPESITSTADGTLFTSSVGEGLVFKAAPHAKDAKPWSARQGDGPQSVLGVLADERSGTLWACYSDMALTKGDTGKPAILRALDLASGQVKHSYPMPAGSFCNDIATGAGDTVYATDTHGGRILRLRSGSNDIATWFQDPRLVGVDGIAFGDDGAIYLTNVKTNALFRLAVAAGGEPGKLTRLKPSAPLQGPDGLRRAGGHFFLAENKSGKVDELRIQGDRVDVETVQGGYKGPTSMTAHGDTLYVVEAKINQFGKVKNPGPFYVYSTPLPD